MGHARDIEFVSSRDGVQLATARYGAGPTLIKAATWLTHIERAAPGTIQQALIDEFAPRFSYVEYDTRGCGLSQRRVGELSFEAWVHDLEAVADAHGREPFTLLGFTCAAGVAVEYAARHPERVSRLILFGGFATSYHSTSHPDPAIRREGDLMIELAELGWGNSSPVFRQVFVSRFLPAATQAQWMAFDEIQRTTATPDVAVRYLRAMYGMNVKEAAARVRCPTLCCIRRTTKWSGSSRDDVLHRSFPARASCRWKVATTSRSPTSRPGKALCGRPGAFSARTTSRPGVLRSA